MKQWHDILRRVMTKGHERTDRTGVGTLALFGEQLIFANDFEFPAVTTKRLAFRQVCAELACFVRGYDNLEDFHRMGCTIWDDNARGTSGSRFRPAFDGDLGRIYGVNWRDWVSVEHNEMDVIRAVYTDQLKDLSLGLRANPYSRRHIVVAYNPGELDKVYLPACHVLFQCFVADGQLDLMVLMRSVDLFLGLPFDVASYAILQRLLARETGLHSGCLVFQLGDAHIYLNHLQQVEEVLRRAPRNPPRLDISDTASLWSFLPEDMRLIDYDPYPFVPAPLNV